jgi:hypothetical protein
MSLALLSARPSTRAPTPENNTTFQISENLKHVLTNRRIFRYRGIRSFSCPKGYEEGFRRSWIDQFEPSATKSQKGELRKLLRRCFVEDASDLRWSKPLGYLANMDADLAYIPAAPIILPIIAHGYKTGATMAHILSKLERRFDFALLACHRHPSMKLDVENRFRHGGSLKPHMVYINGDDQKFLSENSKRPMVIADDFYETGQTAQSVIKSLLEMGCKNLFLFVDSIEREMKKSEKLERFTENSLFYRYTGQKPKLRS